MAHLKTRLTVPMVLVSLIGYCQEPGSYKDVVEQSSQLVKDQLTVYPGVAIAVTVGSDVVWSQGFGMADKDKSIPVEETNTFRLYSLSKTITGLAVAKLEEEGKLDINKNVKFYLPDLPNSYDDVKVVPLDFAHCRCPSLQQ